MLKQRRLSFVDGLQIQIDEKNYLGAAYEPFMLIRNINQRGAIQARLPMDLNIR